MAPSSDSRLQRNTNARIIETGKLVDTYLVLSQLLAISHLGATRLATSARTS